MSNPPELSYEECASVFGVTPRHARTILRRYARLCPPIVYGYRSIRFAGPAVMRVQQRRQSDAIAAFAAARKGGRK